VAENKDDGEPKTGEGGGEEDKDHGKEREKDRGDRDRDRDRRDSRGDRGDRDRDRDRDRRDSRGGGDRDRRDSRGDRSERGDRSDRSDRDRRDRGGPDRDDERPPRPVREPSPDPVQREREEAMRSDLTVLVQRIHPRADDFEIFEFFSQAGSVRDIRLIRDQRSGKSKGVGYVEFGDAESVMKALALNGIAFKGQPLLVQASMAEKNRLAQAAKNAQAANEMMGMGAAAEPTKLMVSELHPHIAEADVREVFAPFGELAEVALMKDPATQASLGVANITYIDPAHAKDAQQAINGLELAGKQLVVQLVQDAPPVAAPMMGGGMGLAPLGGMAGMAGMMGMGGMAGMMGMDAAGPMPTPSLCVLMKNMFDPNGEDEKGDPEFFNDLQEDVKEECGKYGAVVSAKVKPATAGFIYMKFVDQPGATACVGGMTGRWFAGKQISAGYVPEAEYDSV